MRLVNAPFNDDSSLCFGFNITDATLGDFSVDLVFLGSYSDLVISHCNLVIFFKVCISKKSDVFFPLNFSALFQRFSAFFNP